MASLVALLAACAKSQPPLSSGSTSPRPQLPLGSESEHFRFHYEPGESVDAARTEAHCAWATARLGVTLPRKIDYNKYTSRQQMGQYTGYYDTNGFAIPDQFEVHTLWSWDNHEPVHVYSALLGRPSDFFNEGLAVAFQTDPLAGRFESVFNGLPVHQWARDRLQDGTLLSLDGIVVSKDFRSIADTVFSYREAGSFVRYLTDTHGIPAFADFMRRSAPDDSRDVIKLHFAEAFALPLDESESRWHVFLQNLPTPTPQP